MNANRRCRTIGQNIRGVISLALPFCCVVSLLSVSCLSSAQAEGYQSRLNSLILKKNELFLPSRLILGEETTFVIKAPGGSNVKLLLCSDEGNDYTLPDGTSLPVSKNAQELTGVVGDNGVLAIKFPVPKSPELDHKPVYIAAAFQLPGSSTWTQIDLTDATGRRTSDNVIVMMKPSEPGAPSILPAIPGLSPQMFNQLKTLGDVYTNKDNPELKNLLDNGAIDPNRPTDRNPFGNGSIQAGQH